MLVGESTSGFAQAVVLVAAAAIGTAVACYLLAKCRDRISDEGVASDLLTNFREMRHRGHLNESEYRTIKTLLTDQIRGGESDVAPPSGT